SAERARTRTPSPGPGCAPEADGARSRDDGCPLERRRARDDAARVDAEPLLEERRVDAAEVGGRGDVAVVVEALREPGELADHLRLRARPDQEADARRAVVGAGVAVLLRAPPELRPHVHEHAIGEAARLEVALEGEQRVRRELQALGE